MDLTFACRCGALRGVLHEADAADGCPIVCYCRDCRAAARHLGVTGDLHPGGGSPIFQTLPARIEITDGADRLGCLRLSPKGLHRWFAACCDTPIANTGGMPRLPVAGMWRPMFADDAALGPAGARVFTQQAVPRGEGPRRNSGLAGVVAGLVRRGVSALAAGRLQEGPFFDASGAPRATPTVLTGPERAAAYAD